MKIENMKVIVAENQGEISPLKAKSFADIVEYVFSQPDIDKKYQEWLEKRKQRESNHDKT
ncbi:MAG: hypothetical protein IKS03_05605 [Ruminococcus sp.]|nr:hypothetical protein [Ruminococcus sp.]